MKEDSKKFPETGGWGYTQFDDDPSSATFAPNKGGTPTYWQCGGKGKGLSLSPPTGSGKPPASDEKLNLQRQRHDARSICALRNRFAGDR
jgi:hypothetical protein